MRILIDVICTATILLLIVSAVIGDYQKRNTDLMAVTSRISEVVQFSRVPFTGKSAWSTNHNARLWPIIRVRRKRRGTVFSEVTKGREEKRKRQRDREGERRREGGRDRARNPEIYRDGKKDEEKREPLTRHVRRPQRRRSRRPHKGVGTNRTRSHQRGQERRNREKQYLIRNRTLDLLEKKTTAVDDHSSFIYPVNNVRNVLFNRGIEPEKIGQILGDAGRGTSGLRITDLLLPKAFFEAASMTENAAKIKANNFNNGIKPDDELESESNYSNTLGKLKSIAMNVSKMNKAVQKLKTNNTDIKISAGPTDFEETSYGYDYENIFEDPSVSPWVNPPRSSEAIYSGREDQEYFLDKTLLSSVYMPIDDQINLHQGLGALLARFFQAFRNTTDEENKELLQDLDFDNSVQDDLCQKWLDCKEKLEEAFLGPLVLPACPCHYPSSIFYDDKIWDEGQQRHFRWRDVSGEAERLDVYKPGATYCIRSSLAQGGGSAAAQHCCYDGRRRLITRGSGAGTPNYVSPEISAILHERMDLLPWRLCKGDFTRFNKVRQPNNENHCKRNPDDDEYQRQINTTKHY